MEDDTRLAPAEAAAAEGISPEKYSRRFTIGIGLSLAAGLVGATWYVGDRQGFGEIGAGGQNLKLLPKIGQPAPDFVTLTVVDSRSVRPSDSIGRLVWLNFWGSWCPPCRSEMPELVAAYEHLHPRGLELLAVSLLEPAKAAAEFAARNHASFTILSDPDRSDTGAAYPIANFPTHIVIDPEGVIRDIVLAAIDQGEIVKRAANPARGGVGPGDRGRVDTLVVSIALRGGARR